MSFGWFEPCTSPCRDCRPNGPSRIHHGFGSGRGTLVVLLLAVVVAALVGDAAAAAVVAPSGREVALLR